MTDAPERIWAEETGTATKGGQRFRIGRWITDETASHPHEYIRADVARSDAELAVAEAIKRAAEAGADIAERTRPDGFPEAASNAYHSGAMDVVDVILTLAPADALAEVQRLRKTYEELYQDALADAKSDAQDFDSDLWTMVRAYLDELNLDWRDYSDDGITADEALTHIRECMNEETRRAEAAEAEVQRLRAEIDRLTRWRAEEGEKIKRQAKALTDLTKHCQRIEAENAGLARKIGKVQRGDGDHSQIADLEAKVINQRNELANLRARDGRLAELAADRYRLAAANAALEAKVAGLVAALKPFCFFSDEPNTTQEAWEIRYCDRFKDWIDFADIESARAALAQTPTDPGDGWTWNERLGWIGPDGKPADPRRRG